GDDIEGPVQAAAERNAAFFDVRTRDVQFEGRNALRVGQNPRELDVLLDAAAADVDDDRRTPRAEFGKLFSDEPVHADPLQTDRVEHAGRRLDDARRRVALALAKK